MVKICGLIHKYEVKNILMNLRIACYGKDRQNEQLSSATNRERAVKCFTMFNNISPGKNKRSRLEPWGMPLSSDIKLSGDILT